jgi:hypothetical protein
MPNEKHFHGQSHGRGGFDIDEATLSDDARYWMNGAEGARTALEKICKNSDDLIKEFWHVGNSWKTICLKIEAVLEEERAKERKQQSREAAEYHPVDDAPRFCGCGNELKDGEFSCYECVLKTFDAVHPTPAVQLTHQWDEMGGCMNNADYDDLRNLAIGR